MWNLLFPAINIYIYIWILFILIILSINRFDGGDNSFVVNFDL